MLHILTIIGYIGLGLLAVLAVAFTFTWLRNKITNLIQVKRAKRVVVADIHKLIDECDNRVTLNDLNRMSNEGYSKVIVAMDKNDQIIDDVEIYKDTNASLDRDVEELLGRERMVVVEG